METPTNDAPVTVEETLRWYAEMTEQTLGSSETGRRALEHDGGRRAYACLAALASAPAEPLPDIGPDPFKGPRENDRYEGSRLRLRAAYVQQQKGVPDQTALVWRYDLGTVLEMAIRLKSILADDDKAASAPAVDESRAVALVRRIAAREPWQAHYGRTWEDEAADIVAGLPASAPAGDGVEEIEKLIRDHFAGAVVHDDYRENGHTMRDEIDACEGVGDLARQIAALARPRSAVAPAGDGLRLMPILPTQEMLAAGGGMIPGTEPDPTAAGIVWTFMLAAAPAALARPRAAVGEREAIAAVIEPDAFKSLEVLTEEWTVTMGQIDTSPRNGREALDPNIAIQRLAQESWEMGAKKRADALAKADAILALQSPPAKVAE